MRTNSVFCERQAESATFLIFVDLLCCIVLHEKTLTNTVSLEVSEKM